MQPERDAAVFEQQLIAAAAGVNRRLAMVQHNAARCVVWCLQPKRKRERTGAIEVANPAEGEPVFAAQLDSAAELSVDEFWSFVSFGEIGRGEIRDFVRD